MVERSLREALTSEGRAIVVEAKGFG